MKNKNEPAFAYGLYEALKSVGYELPKEYRDVRLIFGACDEPIMIQFDCFLLKEDLTKVGIALQRLAEQ